MRFNEYSSSHEPKDLIEALSFCWPQHKDELHLRFLIAGFGEGTPQQNSRRESNEAQNAEVWVRGRILLFVFPLSSWNILQHNSKGIHISENRDFMRMDHNIPRTRRRSWQKHLRLIQYSWWYPTRFLRGANLWDNILTSERRCSDFPLPWQYPAIRL